MSKKSFFAFLFLAIIAFSFTVTDFFTPDLPTSPYNYSIVNWPIDVVNNFSNMDNTPLDNPVTDHGATLGRVLFYDVDLSQNHTVSCSSCHLQQFSFSDTARFSRGFNGAFTARNSMGLIHARFQRDSAFFWDNRAPSLEAQALMPIQSNVEMGLTLDTLVSRVSAKPFYAQLFQNAFGTATVTTDRIAKALAQFVRSMNTFGSKFRKGVDITNGPPESTPFANFTAQENLGKDLFMDINRGNCQACHTRNVMVQQGAQNIGLDSIYTDNGVGAASGRRAQDGKFSVPSLINVELTPPYMHDGRFKTLEQVIDFYSDSIKQHVNLSGFLRTIIPGTVNPNNNTCDTCPPRRPHYTPTEKAALVAFLKTLTDTVLTRDVRWSNPFTCGTHNVSRITACETYNWNGTTYTNTGTYTRSYINNTGCPSVDTLYLTINRGTHLVTRASTCSSYVWNNTTYSTAGTYVRNYTNSVGCPSADTLILTIAPGSVLSTPAVTQTLVTNTCGARIYRYTSSVVSGATSYEWSLPVSVGGITGVTVDSGNISSSRIIRLKYVSNAAAVNGDSIKIKAVAACASSVLKGYKLTNQALSVPVAPLSVTVTAVQTNVCGSRIYRYSAPVLTAATAGNTAATGYLWSMPTGTVGATGTLDSGTLSSRTIRIRYTSNAAAGNLDSIRVSFTSTCGNSTFKGIKLTNTLLSVPAAPASISIALVRDACGARVYRYIAPALTAATATSTAAIGYIWSLPTGPVGSTGTLDSGTLSSRIIRIKYASNSAAGNQDSIRVAYASACGSSLQKGAKLSNIAKLGCRTTSGKGQYFDSWLSPDSWKAELFPNPSTHQFGLRVLTDPTADNNDNEPISFTVVDASGRVRRKGTLTVGLTYRLGDELEPGVYYIIVQKGDKTKRLVGIKQ